MTRRRFVLLVSLGCLVAVAAYAVWSRPSAINAATAAKIEVGMDLKTVETMLGGPARDEPTGPLGTAECEDDTTGVRHLNAMLFFHDVLLVEDAVQLEWVSDAADVRIVFIDGKAQPPECFAVRRVHDGPWAMLRRWLKLP